MANKSRKPESQKASKPANQQQSPNKPTRPELVGGCCPSWLFSSTTHFQLINPTAFQHYYLGISQIFPLITPRGRRQEAEPWPKECFHLQPQQKSDTSNNQYIIISAACKINIKKISKRHAHTITGTIRRTGPPLHLRLLMQEEARRQGGKAAKNLCHSKLAKCYLNA